MKTLSFREVTTVLLLTMTSPLLAGGVAGGGGPPARMEFIEAQVLEWDRNELGLGVNATLEPQMLVQLSPDDFERVADQQQPIQAVNWEGDVRPYHVAKTLIPDTLMLIAPP